MSCFEGWNMWALDKNPVHAARQLGIGTFVVIT